MLHPYYVKLLFPLKNKINWFLIFAQPCNMVHIFVSKLICCLCFSCIPLIWWSVQKIIWLLINISDKNGNSQILACSLFFLSSGLLCGESGVWRSDCQRNGWSIMCELGPSCSVCSSTGKLLLITSQLFLNVSYVPYY